MYEIDLADVCECEPLPVIYWHAPGGWQLIGTIERDGADDAAAYNAGDFNGWLIFCPTCHEIYGAGGGPGGTVTAPV
jgi:hypothetical protein